MNIIIPQFDPAEHFGQGCQFWNSIDDWFLQRDLIKTHRYSDSLCITDLADAMKPGKICEEFTLRWNRVEGIPPFVHDLFRENHHDAAAIIKALRALPWAPAKNWRTGEPQAGWEAIHQGELEIFRTELRSVRVWSPFAKVNPLPAKPAKWTVAHVVRALLCGQFSNLTCNGIYTDDYAYDAAVNFRMGEFGDRPGAAIAFARRIIESPSGWWASESHGHVSICCHHFDTNSFKFELNPPKPMPTPDPILEATLSTMPKDFEDREAALERKGRAALDLLKGFIGPVQRRIVLEAMRGEEKNFFFEKMIELASRVATMPKTYEQEGKGDDAVATLHYFAGGQANWWITEKDKGSPDDAPEDFQSQAFGLANLFGGPTDQDAELGYISIAEILANGGELDFYFTPITLRGLKAKHEAPETDLEREQRLQPSYQGAEPVMSAAESYLRNL